MARRYAGEGAGLRFEILHRPDAPDAAEVVRFHRAMLGAIRATNPERVVYLAGHDMQRESLADLPLAALSAKPADGRPDAGDAVRPSPHAPSASGMIDVEMRERTLTLRVPAHEAVLPASLLAAVERLANHGLAVVVAIGGSIVAVELISRFLGARSAAVARIGTLAGGAMYLTLGLVPVFLGLAAATLAARDPALKAAIGNAEQLVAVLAGHYLPQWGFVLFAGAIVSAILSVVHAALHAPAAQISHNLVERMAAGLSADARLWSVRLTVMALSVVAYLLAISFSRIKELVELASAFGSAGVLVTTVFALFTRIGGARSAIGAILTGLGVWSLGRFALDWSAPYITALALSTLAYLAIAMTERSGAR